MIDLVLNRRARNLAGEGPIRRALLDAARGVGACVHETNAIDELTEAARAIAARGSSRVILAGGDGSYMAGVTALSRAFGDAALPPLAFAPGGTVSTTAQNWSRTKKWDAREADAIVRAAAANATSGRDLVARPTLRVTDDRGGDRVGFIFGAGLVASFFDEYYAASALGLRGAAGIVARVFAQSFVGGDLARRVLEPVGATLTIDGDEARARAWSLVLASVVPDAGLHMRVTPHAGEALDAFHAVASPLGPRALGPQMPLVLAGRKLVGRGHVDAPRAQDLTLRFADSAKSYVLDGDVVHASEVRVRVGPVIRVAR
jgi:diacylglycerol kinase (ATP)